MLDFALSSEQEMLKSLVERFVADRYDASAYAASRAGPHGYADENWALLAEIGLLALPFAEAHGGMGGGAVDLITAMEAFGRGVAAEPLLNEIVVAGRLLESAGTEAQVAAWLPGLIAGKVHVALAHAEHGTRFDLTRCTTVFENGRLTGAKTCVPGGADLYIVSAQMANGPGLVLVEAKAAGLARRDYRLVDGAIASEIRFDAVAGEPMAGGLPCLLETVQGARMAACAEMIGLASLLFENTLDYVRQRQQFGAAIGSFQAIQHRLADLYALLELSRAHLYRCALAEPEQRDAAIAAAKSYISAAAIRIGEDAIQMHGGMGISAELMIGHAVKRILVLAQLFGDAAHELARYNALERQEKEGRGSAPNPAKGGALRTHV